MVERAQTRPPSGKGPYRFEPFVEPGVLVPAIASALARPSFLSREEHQTGAVPWLGALVEAGTHWRPRNSTAASHGKLGAVRETPEVRRHLESLLAYAPVDPAEDERGDWLAKPADAERRGMSIPRQQTTANHLQEP